ncbi:hypothetical protein [Collimonas sp.]|jgi:hypothetical protein|uniref:hypothetical protein n=1 Tax=Collimonas sp. TaxID=1963772 RepID=UPI002C829534|nr:hypothetical protein [Collimonas sp.]HWX01450.1 hypothetical protein [Collimonas sp.]
MLATTDPFNALSLVEKLNMDGVCKMHLTVQLDERLAERFAALVGISYLVAAIGVACAGAAALILAIRWW